MADSFYNPYHFVPLPDQPSGNDGDCVDWRAGRGLHEVTHDHFVPGTNSGRIICRLTTETPTFVGAAREEQNKGLATRVSHFELPGTPGVPAIPGSSLRGLLSSVAEAASGSAMRILDDTPYTRRIRGQRGQHAFATAHEFFLARDAELLPFNQARRRLTLAERVFGFVSEGRDDAATGNGLAAIAGRLRVADARFHHSTELSAYLPEVTLRTLVSPKPPSPAMYFDPDERGRAILKADLASSEHRPKGRKFYLHQKAHGAPWTHSGALAADTYHPKLCPQQVGNVFYFHVDFDNLTDEELGLLVYAMKPTPTFMHKLGMGKAIGLGSVRVDPIGLFIVERARRYAEASVTGARYHEAICTAGGRQDQGWAVFYPNEAAANIQISNWIATVAMEFVMKNQDADPVVGQIGQAIAWVGALPTPEAPVHWPTVEGQDPSAGENFKWFVINEQRKGGAGPVRQALQSIPAQDVRLQHNPAY